MQEFIKLVKKQMIEKGRDDFGVYLAEILSISPQAAGAKLSGKTRITGEEVSAIVTALDFNAEDLKGALLKRDG